MRLRMLIQTGRRAKGAVALLFVPIIVVIFAFIMFIGSISQVALQKTMTSNSADACTLAGASYMASGIRECAWISRKSYSVYTLLQAIYLVPFCDDVDTAGYPATLWQSFTTTELAPMRYFADVCDGAIQDGWRVGAAACFAGFWNNLIMRGSPSIDPFAYQRALYTAPGNIGVEVSWNTGQYNQHATIGAQYPPMPLLTRQDVPAQQYYVWRRQLPKYFKYYNCQPRGFGWNQAGPLAMMKAQDRVNPLMAPPPGLKMYEIPDDPYGGMGPAGGRIPQVRPGFAGAIPYGECAFWVCGIDVKDLPTATQLLPVAITPTNAAVQATVTHQSTSGGPGGFLSAQISSHSCASYEGAPTLGPTTNAWLANGMRVHLTCAQ